MALAYRYWRLMYRDIQSGGVRGEAAEIQLRGTVGGADLTGSGTKHISENRLAIRRALGIV